MVNISRKFMQQLYNDQRNYFVRVVINLADTNQTVLTLTNENIWDFSPTIDDAVSSDEDLQVGTAIINKFSFTINNIYETYSQYDFKDAKVFLTVGLDIGDDTVERIKKGTFYVDTADYNDTFITLECLDGMHKFEKPFKVNTITFPATAGYVVNSICTACGVILDTTSFPNKDYIITSAPDKDTCTYREVLSWIAQICGCFARFNSEGHLELKWYDRTSLETVIDGLDGGVFDVTTLSSYQTGDTVNGGSFNPWNTGDVYDSGDFTDMIKNVHFINTAYSHTMSVDDVVITGVRILVKTKDVVDSETGAVTNTDVISTHFQGTEGYIIEISENPFITEDNVNVIISYLGTQLIGLRFRKANLSVPSDPSIEAGDVAIYWDRKGIYHPILVSRTTFITGDAQTIVSSAQTPARNSAERYSAETKNYVAVRKQIREEKNARQLMFDNFQEQMEHASGMYCTEVEDEETHAVTTYYHNKPLLEESDIQIVISDVGISVTNTGTAETPTWYGLKVDGDFIAHILAAEGINADWINAGTLIIKDANNNETLFADTQTGEVRINASTVRIGGTEFNQKVQQIIEANDFDTDNLLIDSTGFSSDYWETSGTVDTGQTDPYGGTDAIRITPTSSAQGYIRAKRSNNNPYKTTGAWYRFSVWLKASSSSSGAITLYLNNEAYSITPTTAWKQYWFDKEVTSVSSSNNLASIGGESSFTTADGYSLYVYNPRVFYTQKPETMREMFNRLTGNSKNQGLYIDTDSQGVDRAFVNLTYAQTGELSVKDTNGNETFYVNADTGVVRMNATAASVSGTSIANIAQNAADGAYTNAKNYVDGKGYQTAANVQDYVNAKMSGLDTNLLKDSLGLSSDYWVLYGTVTRNQSDPAGGTNAIKLQPTSGSNGEGFLHANFNTNNPFKSSGSRYKFSVWIKSSANASMFNNNGVKLFFNSEATDIYPTTSWKKYEVSGVVTTAINRNFIGVGGESSFTPSDGYDLYIYNPTVEYTFTYEEVYKALTNDGRNDGWWIVDNHLYMNLTYLQSGILKLGGNVNGINNGNGELHVYDGANKKCATFDTNGITLLGTSSGYTNNKTLLKEGFIDFYYNNVRKGYIEQNTSGLEIHGKATGSTDAVKICATQRDSGGNLSQATIASFGDGGIHFERKILPADFQYIHVTGRDTSTGHSLVAEYAINAAGGIQTTSIYYSGSLVPTSDKRLKENIKPIVVDIIDELNVVQFDWKESGKHVSAGLIAQDVEKILPELVEDRPDGYKGLKYLDLVPHLIHKVQQQQKQIDDLEARIERLEALMKEGEFKA